MRLAAIWLVCLMVHSGGSASAATPPKPSPPSPRPKPVSRPPSPKPRVSGTPAAVPKPKPAPKTPPPKGAPVSRSPMPKPKPAALKSPLPKPILRPSPPKPRPSGKPKSPAPRPKTSTPGVRPSPKLNGPKPAPGRAPAPHAAPRSPPPAPLALPTSGNITLLSSARANLCLSPAPVGGRQVVTATCDGSARQLWAWSTAAKTLTSALSGLCLTYNSNLTDGSAVSLQACVKGSRLQQWDYTPFTFGPLQPLAAQAWCLHINGFNTSNGASLSMWNCMAAQADFNIGKFFLFALRPGKCANLSPLCSTWVKQGRCALDPLFMSGSSDALGACPVACGTCPVPSPPSPRPPPPRPPYSNRPPRGGGAQGGADPCWDKCPDGYDTVQLSFTDAYCVRPELRYPPKCQAGGSSEAPPCQCVLGGTLQDDNSCYQAPSKFPKCGSPPPRASSPPPRRVKPRYWTTLARTYTDDSGAVRPGWRTEDLSFTDGNIFASAMLLAQMPLPSHDDSDEDLAVVIEAASRFLSDHGGVGDVKWLKINWDRDGSGVATRNPTGGRTARAAVFRTSTDVFVLIPGADTGAMSIQLPTDVAARLPAYQAGNVAVGTGDWATNFETGTYRTLDPLDGVKVAQGFHDMFATILAGPLQDLITASLQEVDSSWAPRRRTDAGIYWIGHGQGAAISVIAAACFYASGFPLSGAYLFGDPAVTAPGDPALRDYFWQPRLRDRVFRIVNSNDIVPSLSPLAYHVGQPALFCQDEMQTWDSFYGEPGSPICSAKIVNFGQWAGVPLPASLDDNNAMFSFYLAVAILPYRLSDIIQLHDPVFYATNALRTFNDLAQQPQTPGPLDPHQTAPDPHEGGGSTPMSDLTALLSTRSWPRYWLSDYCLNDAYCTSQCGVLTDTDACGAEYVCTESYRCSLPAPPPPCTTWWGTPC